LQISSPPRPNFSVSPISPSPKSESQHPSRTCHHRLCSCILDSLPYPLFYTPTLSISSLLHPRFHPRTILPTLAQRTSGAGSRAKSRWQPYNPTPIASTLRPPAPYLNTPFLLFQHPHPIQDIPPFAIPTFRPMSSNANLVRPRASSRTRTVSFGTTNLY
jgi:hypothetical protein